MAKKAFGQQLLLVNSNQERLNILQTLLEDGTDFHILTADSASSAISVLRSNDIKIIISNIKLDNFDGWRLARLVRSGIFPCAKETPFIIIANTWCEHIATTTAREFGVNQLISFEDRHTLVNIINRNKQPTQIEEIEKSPLLVIEDNPDTQDLVKRILSQKFIVDCANNGEVGLAKWREKNYALVLLDVMLPGMSGNQVLHKIMQQSPHQSVVIMTANHTMELAEELMLAGAADFVTKPFRAYELRRVCESAARREDFMISNEQFAAKVDSLNQSRQEYKRLSEAHQHLLDQLGSVVIELNSFGNITFLNQAWEKLTGYSIGESLQQPFLSFTEKSDDSPNHTINELKKVLSGDLKSHYFEFRFNNKQGEEIWAEARFQIYTDSQKRISNISGTIDNVTARIKAQRDLEYVAMHDSLTGLFNRHFFETELKQFSATASRGNGPHALLYIDLDHFKIINDTLGHQQGDSVLKTVATLLSSHLRETDIFCRIGGDEFAILLPNSNRESAQMIAQGLCKLLNDFQCNVANQTFKINCSIGIAEITGKEKASGEYMKQADIALYVAKKQGRNLAHTYSESDAHSKNLQASMEWSRRLHQAVAKDNLILYFQPVIRISDRTTAYFEALVRLNIDDRIIPPGEFIPALEREGDMNLLDHQVIKKAVKYLADYPKLNKIAINLSAQGFSDERLVPMIKRAIEKHQVDASRIIFELTESASLSNITATRKIVSKLRELGCEFSIDDFGTGFSTFNYLKQLPAESVKIDGSFIIDIINNPVDRALVKAILEVATVLNKKTVAEFVENEETLELLQSIGIALAQGYHLGKPQPIEHYFGLLDKP